MWSVGVLSIEVECWTIFKNLKGKDNDSKCWEVLYRWKYGYVNL